MTFQGLERFGNDIFFSVFFGRFQENSISSSGPESLKIRLKVRKSSKICDYLQESAFLFGGVHKPTVRIPCFMRPEG